METLIWGSWIGWLRMTLARAATRAAGSQAAKLLSLLASPVSERAPVRAAASAAFCACVRASASKPMSIARATKPIRTTMVATSIGSTVPRLCPRFVLRPRSILTNMSYLPPRVERQKLQTLVSLAGHDHLAGHGDRHRHVQQRGEH